TSVPSEEVFSISGDMITDKRNKFADKTVWLAMCLRPWWREFK
ncbi:22857_t:CDS:1, partial [Cetraspora pellucida]